MTAPRRPFDRRRTSPFSVLNRPVGPTPSATVTDALEQLTNAGARLRELRQQHWDAVQRIRREVSANTNLSAEGKQAALRERTTAAGQSAYADLRGLREQIERAEQSIVDTVERQWPKPMPGVEGLLSRQAAWARSRSLLEAGMKVSTVISETTDVETLLSLRDELPTWVRARGANPATIDRVLQRIDAQMAKVASGTTEVDLMARFEARALVAGLQPVLDLSEAEALGHTPFGNSLHAAVAGDIARRATLAAYEPIIAPDGNVL